MWTHLDFSAATRYVSLGTVTNYIKHSRNGITRASLQVLAAQNTILNRIATRCNALTHLELLGGFTGSGLVEAAPALRGLKSLVVAVETSLSTISQVLFHCASLENAQFLSVTAKHPVQWEGHMTNLRTLSIDAKKRDPDRRSILLQLVSLSMDW